MDERKKGRKKGRTVMKRRKESDGSKVKERNGTEGKERRRRKERRQKIDVRKV